MILEQLLWQCTKLKNTNRQKKGEKNGRRRFCPCYLLTATVAESLQSSHSHRSAHTGAQDGGGLFCTLFWGYLVLFEPEPLFGVKIISWLTLPHYKQDKPNTPEYRNPAHCLQVLFSFFLWICLHFISWSKQHKPLTGTETQLAGEKTVKFVPEVAPATSHWRERETSDSRST